MRPLHPHVLQYLDAIAHATDCTGMEAFHRTRNDLPSTRTVYRWQRTLGTALAFFPSFDVLALGLVHLHLVIDQSVDAWLRFPYVIEHAWVSREANSRALYLHCLVPREHRDQLENTLREAPTALRFWSGNPWQQIRLTDQPNQRPPAAGRISHQFLLRTTPLIVPVIAETWGHRHSLPALWRRIHQRIGSAAGQYLPRRRVLKTNGKAHVKHAFAALQRADLFIQHLVRYGPLHEQQLELLVLIQTVPTREWLDRLEAASVMTEAYPGAQHVLLRILASNDALRQVMATPGVTVLIVHTTGQQEGPRFAYELLFQPRTGTWSFPANHLRTLFGTRA